MGIYCALYLDFLQKQTPGWPPHFVTLQYRWGCHSASNVPNHHQDAPHRHRHQARRGTRSHCNPTEADPSTEEEHGRGQSVPRLRRPGSRQRSRPGIRRWALAWRQGHLHACREPARYVRVGSATDAAVQRGTTNRQPDRPIPWPQRVFAESSQTPIIPLSICYWKTKCSDRVSVYIVKRWQPQNFKPYLLPTPKPDQNSYWFDTFELPKLFWLLKKEMEFSKILYIQWLIK